MSNVILQPASQNFRVATNDECDRPGTMCASVIESGSHGMSRLHVWVDFIMDPLGSLIDNGEHVRCSFFTAAPLMMKCAVAPESRMAYSGGCFCVSIDSSSDDRSSSVRSAVVVVALSHSWMCEQLDVMTVLSSSSLSLRIL